MPALYSVGDIAREAGNVPVHRVLYVVRTRDIQPAGRAGGMRLFTRADAERIISELRRIAGDRYPADSYWAVPQ